MPKTPALPKDLPPDWEAKDVGGRIVYINHSTRTTQWERPQAPKKPKPRGWGSPGGVASFSPTENNGQQQASFASKRDDEAEEDPLPDGWECRPIDGRKVYIDHANKVTSFERPTAQSTPSAEGTGSAAGSASKEAGAGGRWRGGNKGKTSGPLRRQREPEEELPPGWAKNMTPTGDVYYVNHTTKTTTWTKPSLDGELGESGISTSEADESVISGSKESRASRGKTAAQDDEEEELPEGWEKRLSVDGQVFYVNHVEKTTSWTPPVTTTGSSSGTPKRSKVLPVSEAVDDHEDEDHSRPEGASRPESEPISSQLPPLPHGWIELKTDAGRTYYQNSILRTTQWTRPKAEPESVSASGWQKVMTSDGRPYYQNTITRETRWAKPDGWEETEDDVDSYGASRSESDRHRPRVSVASSDGAKGTDREAGKDRGNDRMGTSSSSSQRPSVEKEDGVQEAPLPPGWEKMYTDDGTPFWTNHNTQTTSWDPPPPAEPYNSMGHNSEGTHGTDPASEGHDDLERKSAPNLDADGNPLPEGWELQRTDQGVPYYVNHIGKCTSWDPPVAKAQVSPAELVPDEADLYEGADLLNRFFQSWDGDTQGKSPLEGARNVIVLALTGPSGLKVTKGRSGGRIERYLYLSPNNRQLVWASKPSARGKLSKKGFTLRSVSALECRHGTVIIETRDMDNNESPTLAMKSTDLASLTSEGATVLLGVLLADMTGTSLSLYGVAGIASSRYYPAAFVNEVLRIREERQAAKERDRATEEPLPDKAGEHADTGAEETTEACARESPRETHEVQQEVRNGKGGEDDEPEQSPKSGASASRGPPPEPGSEDDVPKRDPPPFEEKDEDQDGEKLDDDDDDDDEEEEEEEEEEGEQEEEEEMSRGNAKRKISDKKDTEDLATTPYVQKGTVSAPPEDEYEEPEIKQEKEVPAAPVVKLEAEDENEDPDPDPDPELEEYKTVLMELLQPVKLGRYVQNFLDSDITLDILPLVINDKGSPTEDFLERLTQLGRHPATAVERRDLENVVGISEPVPQLKILKQIKKRFPNGV